MAQQRLDGEFPLLHNGKDSYFVSVSGWAGTATSSSGGQAQLEVHAKLPLAEEAIAAAVDVLEGVAEGARARTGDMPRPPARGWISRQTKNWAANPQPPPRGLPALKLPWNIPSPELPHRLGWITERRILAAPQVPRRAGGAPASRRGAEEAAP
ncbi:DUF5953 family protein [Hyalangium sp.]|uniref:DUF5953 family protein n=1 Tax=Hyalangium sp. TaxID=2028555 RepID=UPI0039C85B6E